MHKRLWIGAALLAAIGISAAIARAQIIFPDGTTQQTAFTGSVTVPVGAAFATTKFSSSGNPAAIGATPVPAGKQLVILRVIVNDGAIANSLLVLESRLPSPNQNTGPITLALCGYKEIGDDHAYGEFFPDGTVVVAAGRLPWVRAIFPNGVTNGSLTPAVTILGYLRDA